ncbi:MAG: 30S ribosome-binding factor RbfA [Buchnera aphidicola (Nurudea ibofushi)]
MFQSNRLFRISKELQKTISWIIRYSLTDSRFKNLITISRVKISRDLCHSKIYVSIFDHNDSNMSHKNIMLMLTKSSRYIRYLLAQKICLRVIPILNFVYDDSYIQGVKISNLINRSFKK